MEGAVERVRPKMMTVVAITAGLLPIHVGNRHREAPKSAMRYRRPDGRRNDPSDLLLTLAVIPAIYALTKQWQLR